MTTVILRALNEEDVEGFLAAGAPTDEYETEAEMIADELARVDEQALELDHVITIVTNVCNRMFGPFDEEGLQERRPVYGRVAQRIMDAWNSRAR